MVLVKLIENKVTYEQVLLSLFLIVRLHKANKSPETNPYNESMEKLVISFLSIKRMRPIDANAISAQSSLATFSLRKNAPIKIEKIMYERFNIETIAGELLESP